MAPLPQRTAAELLGTFLLVVVAAGIVIVDSVTLVGIAAGTGIIVMLMVYVDRTQGQGAPGRGRSLAARRPPSLTPVLGP